MSYSDVDKLNPKKASKLERVTDMQKESLNTEMFKKQMNDNIAEYLKQSVMDNYDRDVTQKIAKAHRLLDLNDIMNNYYSNLNVRDIKHEVNMTQSQIRSEYGSMEKYFDKITQHSSSQWMLNENESHNLGEMNKDINEISKRYLTLQKIKNEKKETIALKNMESEFYSNLSQFENTIQKFYKNLGVKKQAHAVTAMISYINAEFRSVESYLLLIEDRLSSNMQLNESPSNRFAEINKDLNQITQEYLRRNNDFLNKWDVSSTVDMTVMFEDQKLINQLKNKNEVKLASNEKQKSLKNKSQSNSIVEKNSAVILPKLSLFKRLGIYLQSYWKTKNTIIVLSPEEQALQDKLNRLLEHAILPEINRMVKNGASLTNEQQLKFDIQLNHLISKDNTQQLKEMLNEGYFPKKELIANWIMLYSEMPNIQKVFQEELKTVWKDKAMISDLMNHWIHRLKNHSVTLANHHILQNGDKNEKVLLKDFNEQKKLRELLNKDMEKTLNYFDVFKSALTIEEYIHVLELFKKINEEEKKSYSIYRRARVHLSFLIVEDTMESGKSYRKVLDDSARIEENLLSQINEFYKIKSELEETPFKVELSQYPQEIQEQLALLDTKIQECKKEREHMSTYEWERLAGLWNNILNKSLVSYSQMSDKHKEELLSVEGKTPQQLLSETINHVNDALDQKLLEINEERLHSMSVTQRYAQTIKKTL